MAAYDRDLYGDWVDADGDCQNTRHEVLIDESTVPVTLDSSGCKVVSGRWEDPYTELVFTNPRNLDIDHFIPLAEVHRSGGYAWTPAQRREYANDLSNPNTLIAVEAGANRSKRDRDPAHWLPPNQVYHCEYIRSWVDLKNHWALSMDPVEEGFLADSGCLDLGMLEDMEALLGLAALVLAFGLGVVTGWVWCAATRGARTQEKSGQN